MDKVTVSAPGKLLLYGDHAVVYGQPAIVTAIDQRVRLTAKKIPSSELLIDAPDTNVLKYNKKIDELGKNEIPKGVNFIEIAVTNFYKKYHIKTGLHIQTKSQFKSTFGFGSSSAITVCTIKALCLLFNKKLNNKEIFDLCLKTVLEIQGVGSGFDIASAIYGGTIYYIYPGKIIKPLHIQDLNLIIGYTGIKADTATIVKRVAEQKKTFPKLYDDVFLLSGKIVNAAKKEVEKSDFEKIGKLMNLSQGILESIEVSSKILTKLILAARESGAFGAKLSGAGVGDCMIAIAPKEKTKLVEMAVKKAGGQVMKVKINAEGVKIEI